MAVKGYTQPDRVASLLGRTFSPAENELCLWLLEAAEERIDRETGRSWLGSTTVTAEEHLTYSDLIVLNHSPVTSVTSVVDEEGNTVEYETVSLSTGLLRLLVAFYDKDRLPARVRVSYVHSEGLPSDVDLACAELVASWMPDAESATSSVSAMPSGIKRYQVGGELSVEYFGAGEGGQATASIPKHVMKILLGLRREIFA